MRNLPPVEEIRRQRKDGLTLDKIGSRYGVSRQAVHKELRKAAKREAAEASAPAN